MALVYSDSISAHTAMTTTESSGHDGQGRCMRNGCRAGNARTMGMRR